MNIYKRVKSNSLYVLPIETECFLKPEENLDCLTMEPECCSEPESYSEPECCLEPECCSEPEENFNSLPEEKELGFTVYGEPSKLKYKIYQT